MSAREGFTGERLPQFPPEALEALIACTHVIPAVNYVELHPFFIQGELREVAPAP